MESSPEIHLMVWLPWNLSRNDIDDITDGTFSSMMNLKKLNLEINNLTHLPEGAFRGHPFLQTEGTTSSSPPQTAALQVSLYGNPFHSDGDISWLIEAVEGEWVEFINWWEKANVCPCINYPNDTWDKMNPRCDVIATPEVEPEVRSGEEAEMEEQEVVDEQEEAGAVFKGASR